jgi:excisionase family DNA binding protein
MSILSTGEAAEKLQVSPDTVLRLIRSGELPASRLTPTGYWRIRQEDLEDYAKQRGVELIEAPQK